jgi:hypothetical protein
MLLPSLGYSFLDAEVTLTQYMEDAAGWSKILILFLFLET